MSSSYRRRKQIIRTMAPWQPIIVMAGSALLFCLLMLAMPRSAAALGRWIPATADAPRTQAFVISQNESGEIACREATPDERRMAAVHDDGGPTRVIYSGAPRRKDLPYGSQLWISDEAAGLSLQVSAGLRIVLHGTVSWNKTKLRRTRSSSPRIVGRRSSRLRSPSSSMSTLARHFLARLIPVSFWARPVYQP